MLRHSMRYIVITGLMSFSSAWPQGFSFSTGVTYPVQHAPLATATADFNGDGKLDLAVADAGSSTVSIFLGKGDGTFNTSTTVTIPGGCLADNLTAGDFNNDGKVDLLAVCGFQSTVWVLPGLGTGQFGTPVSTALPPFAMQGWFDINFNNVVVADFNGDGKLDLVLATSSDWIGNNPTLELDLLLGNGDGTFRQPSTIVSGGLAGSVVVTADFDGDGKPDLAVGTAEPGDSVLNGSVTILRGDGKGSFQNVATYATPGSVLAGSMTVAEVNRDGIPDLIVASGTIGKTGPTVLSPTLTVYLGNGDCTFKQGASLNETTGIGGLVAADFRGTGTPDLLEEQLTANSPGKGMVDIESTMAIRAGNGDGTFQSPVPISMPAGFFPWWFSMAVGDWNGDGLPDLAFTASPSSIVLNNTGTSAVAWDIVVAAYQAMPAGDLVVMLNALTPPPAIALSNHQLQFSSLAGGANPPALSVTISNSGGGTLNWTARPSVAWLSVTPASGTGPSKVNIAASPGGMTPGQYSAAIQIAAAGASNSPQTISVTLTITVPSTLPTITGVASAAGYQVGIESGSWVSIYGTNLASRTRLWQISDFTGNNLPLALDGSSATIDGKPAAVYGISPTQINVQAPTDAATGPVPVVVSNNGQVSAAFMAQLQTYAPAFFLYSGTTYALAQRYPDNAQVGNPSAIPGTVAAKPGDILTLWGSGFGPTIPPTPAGIVVVGAPPVATLPVVTVGGVQVQVLGAVLSPDNAGLYQVAIQLPQNVPTGAVSLQASAGGVQSPSNILIFVSGQ
jgi:uncharacterized protein (TIGR03437 family)